MRQLVVLSYDLRVLCCDKGRLFAYPLAQYEDSISLAFLRPDGTGDNFCAGHSAMQWLDLNTMSFCVPCPEGYLKIEERVSDQGGVRLKICDANTGSDEYLFVVESGELIATSEGRRKRNGAFRCVTMEEFRAIRDFIQAEWVGDETLKPSTVDLIFSNIWELHIGGSVMDFNNSLNNIVKSYYKPNNYDVVGSGINVSRIVKFNPAVFYNITETSQLPKLSYSLQSLHQNGKFEGSIFIASSLKSDHILSFVPKIVHGNLKIIPIRNKECSPLCLSTLNVINCDGFYPIIALDENVVIAKSLQSYLVDSALNPFLSKNLETDNLENAEYKENIFLRDDAYSHGDAALFLGKKIRGSLAFLQNRSFIQTALRSYKVFMRQHSKTSPDHDIESEFINYLIHQYSLCKRTSHDGASLKNMVDTLFMDISSWSLEECGRYIRQSSHNS